MQGLRQVDYVLTNVGASVFRCFEVARRYCLNRLMSRLGRQVLLPLRRLVVVLVVSDQKR